MKSINITKEGILQYYGNRVGYVKNGTAVVDVMFKKPDINDFLTKENGFNVEWQKDIYDRLIKGDIGNIIHLIVKDINARLSDREISIEITPAAETYIVEEGYDPVYGARPLKRFVQKYVETLAAKMILADEVTAKDTILIDYDKEIDELESKIKGRY